MSVLSIPDAPDCEDLLRWLRAHEVVDRKGLGVSLNTAILLARAMEGDASAVAVLAELAADPWWTERTDAEHAIEALIEARGPAVVPSALGCGSMQALARHGRSPAERLLGVRCLWREGGDIAACLADDSALVARKAYEFLTGSDVADENLLAMVRERRPGCVWALAVLHERGRDIRPLWGGDGPPRVELPGVPSDVREAIGRRYTPGQRDTDPRWLVEAALLEPPPPREDVEDLIENRLELAFQTLRAAGLEPQEPQSAGRFHGLGGGTYHLIETDVGRVCLSTLGPFFSVADRGEQARAALQVAGFRHIGKELASIEFSKLHVYFFGDREPLKVYDLLFYWQD